MLVVVGQSEETQEIQDFFFLLYFIIWLSWSYILFSLNLV